MVNEYKFSLPPDPQGLYHDFEVEFDTDPVLLGEVSQCNEYPTAK